MTHCLPVSCCDCAYLGFQSKTAYVILRRQQIKQFHLQRYLQIFLISLPIRFLDISARKSPCPNFASLVRPRGRTMSTAPIQSREIVSPFPVTVVLPRQVLWSRILDCETYQRLFSSRCLEFCWLRAAKHCGKRYSNEIIILGWFLQIVCPPYRIGA